MATEDFSQRGEQEQILKYFGDKADGRFLDIGAADGKTFSTTHALALRGWSGVCIEPNPHMLIPLMELYKDRKDIIVMAAAAIAMHEPESVTMYITPDFLSSTSAEHRATWEKVGVKFIPMDVMGVPVGSLYSELGVWYHMINIDVEGNNWEILTSMDPYLLDQVKLLCIEFEGMADKMAAFGVTHGLKKIHQTEENLILARV